jgi:tRNA threonylcarbamoyladenosine biosynthesis protein TsaB
MLILTIRTDKPEAEIGLYENDKQLAYETWLADRQLSITIHKKIEGLLKSQKKNWQSIEGLVCFKGPGSFTGLRLGLTVGNALAQGLSVTIVSTKDSNWTKKGIKRLLAGEDEKVVLPTYGSPIHITKPRK